MERQRPVLTSILFDRDLGACLVYAEIWWGLKVGKGKLRLEFREQDVYRTLKRPWVVLNQNGIEENLKILWSNVKAFLWRSSSWISTCQYILLASRVRIIVTSLSDPIHSSMSGIRHESLIVTALNLPYSTQKRGVPSLLKTKTIGEAHSVLH